MGKVLDMIIKFVKYFICKWFATRVIEKIVILLLEELVKICKWFATRVIEKIVILLLEELVKRTDSKLDDKIYQAVFEEVENRA